MYLHWIWFAELSGLSDQQKIALLHRFSDPEEILYAPKKVLTEIECMTPEAVKVLLDPDFSIAKKIEKDCRSKNIRILSIADDAYPERLRNIDEPPVVLYCKGQLPNIQKQPIVSVVGTRKASAYGLNIARSISRQIVSCGALVASGGASGIDTMAMHGALDMQTPVIGVLGCGVDVTYPRSNRSLFEEVIQKGCLLSEYPPGTRPNKWNFPRRNRILSGMANGVLVVEAPQSSGALITARHALREGRDVFVVPGNIDVESCAGSNALLREGANAAFSGWDIVKEYTHLYPGKLAENKVVLPLQETVRAGNVGQAFTELKVAQNKTCPESTSASDNKKSIDKTRISNYIGINDLPSDVTQEERQILLLLQTEPRSVDDLIAELGQPASKVLRVLTMLSLKGIVRNHPGKRVSLNTEIPK